MATVKLETVLGRVPLFQSLSRRHLKHLAGLCELADYMGNATIVKEGTDGDAFFVVLKGQAKITAHGRFLSRVLPGDHFGEIAALDGGPRTASVTSETPMTLAEMSRKALVKALHDDPEIAFELLGELARMFRRVSKDAYR